MENEQLILEALARLTKQVSDINAKQCKADYSIDRSEQLKDLFTALAKAQSEMKTANTSKSNPYFKSKYSDMTEVVRASRPALTKHGLAVIQQIKPNEDGANILHTVLTHCSGQWIESRMRIIPPKADIQALGSHITYLRRYSYASLVGVISADEDDDGEMAVHESRGKFNKGTQLNHKYNPKEQSPEVITKEQLEEIRFELASHTDLAEEIMEKMKIRSLADMPKNLFLVAIKKVREIVQLRDGK